MNKIPNYELGDQVICWYAPQYKGAICFIDTESRNILYYVSPGKPKPKNQFGSTMVGMIFLGWQLRKNKGRPRRSKYKGEQNEIL